jgi:hypothetical protein
MTNEAVARFVATVSQDESIRVSKNFDQRA